MKLASIHDNLKAAALSDEVPVEIFYISTGASIFWIAKKNNQERKVYDA